MPSITYWNRLEPRPRSKSVAGSLSAELRDPLWMLTRQWQFGEFRGEDAGSPAYVELRAHVTRLGSWQTPGGPLRAPIAAAMPLEALIEGETTGPGNFLSRVELGQLVETLLRERGAADV